MKDTKLAPNEMRREIEALRTRVAELEQQALSARQENTQALFDNMTLGFFSQKADGTLVDCNQALLEMFGLSRDEFLGRTSLHPDWRVFREDGVDLSGEEHPSMQALLTGQPIRDIMSGVFNPLKQEIRWLLVSAFPLFREGETKPDSVLAILEDITERKAAEEERRQARAVLRANEERYQQLFDTITTGVAVYRPVDDGEDFVFVDINPAGLLHGKVTRDAVIGRRIKEVYPNVEELGLLQALRDVARTGEIAHLPARLYRDGRIEQWVENTVHSLPDGNIAAVFEDTTVQYKAEEARRRSEVLHRTLVEAIPDLVWLKSPEGVYLSCNKAFEGFFGASESEIMGKTDADFVSGELAEFFRTNDQKAIELDGPSINEEWLTLANTGYRGLFETVKTPLRDAHGVVVGVLGVARDITERKRLEEVLREGEERLRAVLDATPFPVAVVDDSDENILFWSRSATDLFGHTVSTTSEWFELAYPDPEYRHEVIERWKPYVATAKKEGGPINTGEYRVTCADGSERICELYATFIPGRLIVTLHDVTERKRADEERAKLEAQFLHSQRLESVGRLAGGIAHDFNNLLTGITGNVSLAMMDLSPIDPLRESLREVEAAAHSAARLTQQLLAFSRKQIIKPIVFDLNELVQKVQSMVRRLIGENIRLRTVTGEGSGIILADPGQLEQTLVNLVVNARDAMAHGGDVTIKTGRCILDSALCRSRPGLEPGPYMTLEVSDTGAGMDSETQEKVFDPFFTTKKDGRGTGLGLATVYGIVKQHGGSIDVLSNLGEGTTFRIYLPEVQAEATTLKPPEESTALPKGKERILVVEDEPMVQKIVALILGRQGYEVLVADSGEAALDLAAAEEFPIDLLMTDIVMEGMNGRELADRLQPQRPNMKVLFTSGYTEDVIDRHGVLETGLNFIGKPYSPQDLARKVRDILDG